MRVIMVMYDSLNRNYLPNYGCREADMPNFERLGKQSVTFENNYAGSLPCMPARRELHTGRYNFLHREWGPLEPFDDSMPELLKKSGVYTHLISDHCHYWEDGGSTYHNRYSTWQNVRGQEGDRWIPRIGREDKTEYLHQALEDTPSAKHRKQNCINREYIKARGEFPQEETFRLGVEFIEHNHDQDQWFLQIETFDPHEPFSAPERLKQKYIRPKDKNYDWPAYGPAFEADDIIEGVRDQYRALLGLCDECLGKILDMMDRYRMWDDTMLIVNTDHGYLLGERQWWGKNIMPLYNEIVRTPLFIWDPRCRKSGERRSALVQTIDLAPTLLDFFHVPIPKDVQGKALKETIEKDTAVREYALYGNFGSHINITDGTWYYMRSPRTEENKPLFCYTQLPLNLIGRMPVHQIELAELTAPFSFTKNTPLMKIPVFDYFNTVIPKYRYGDRLLKLDVDQKSQIAVQDEEKEAELINAMRILMIESDAPVEQYERVGIAVDQEITADDVKKEKIQRREMLMVPYLQDVEWSEQAVWEYIKVCRMKQEELPEAEIADKLKRIVMEHQSPFVSEAEVLLLVKEIFKESEYPIAVVNVMREGKIE